jgi:tetratricopeptide (TPR) repeat protein
MVVAALALVFASARSPEASGACATPQTVSLEKLRQRVNENPQDAKLRVALADALDDSGDSAGAIVQYREAIRLDPNLAVAYRNMALAHLRRSEWAAAETAARDAIRLRADYVQARCDLATILANKGDNDASARVWEQALQISRDDVLAYARLGRTPAEKEEAERAASAALAQLLVSIALRSTGDTDRAIREAQRATQVDPKFALAWRALADLLEYAGKKKEATKAFEAAFTLNPALRDASEKKPAEPVDEKSPEAQARKAEIAAMHGMIPNLSRILHMSSATEEQKQKAAQILQATAVKLQGYLRESPDDLEALLLFGESLRELGESPRAERAYRTIIQKAGDADRGYAAMAWRGMARMALAGGREPDALDLLALGLRAAPGQPELVGDTAMIYATARDQKLRDPQLALSWAQRAVDGTRGKSADCLRALAEAQFASGQTAEAIKTQRRAIELVPADESYKDRLREMLAALAKR